MCCSTIPAVSSFFSQTQKNVIYCEKMAIAMSLAFLPVAPRTGRTDFWTTCGGFLGSFGRPEELFVLKNLKIYLHQVAFLGGHLIDLDCFAFFP